MKSLLVTLGLLSIGCGSSSDLTNNQGFSGPVSSALNSSEFLGRVVDEAGAPVSGVDVVVHERTSDLKFKANTASDGTFRLLAPRGTYDLGLNKALDPTSATCFYGPVINPGTGVQDFTLGGVGGRSADTLFGQILSGQGQSDGGRRLIVQPALAHSGGDQPLPGPVEVVTGSQGRFETHLLSTRPLSLDLDIYESTGLSEWVDVAKLDKACYVKLSTGATIPKNRLRAAQ